MKENLHTDYDSDLIQKNFQDLKNELENQGKRIDRLSNILKLNAEDLNSLRTEYNTQKIKLEEISTAKNDSPTTPNKGHRKKNPHTDINQQRDLDKLSVSICELDTKLQQYTKYCLELAEYIKSKNKVDQELFSDLESRINHMEETYYRYFMSLDSGVGDPEYGFTSGNAIELARSLHEESLNSISETDTQLRQYVYDEISATQDKLDQKLQSVVDVVNKLVEDNKKLLSENKELKKELEFYTEIESDSANLNETADADNNKKLLEVLAASLPDGVSSGKSFKEIRESNDNSETPARIIESSKNTAGKNASDKVNLSLDDEQKLALNLLQNTSDNLFITGKAGTGKSFLLSAFCRIAETSGISILKLAPTGIAALNILGTTLHRALGYDNLETIDIKELNSQTLKLHPKKKIVLKESNYIIIDEISMVNADVFDKIDMILRIVCKNNLLFGGKRIILFGDVFQLSPVLTNSTKRKYLYDKYGSEFFFDSTAYKMGNFHFLELKTNHRQQKDVYFFEMLNRIREGKTTDEDHTRLNNRVIADKSEARRILTLYPTKDEADRVNKTELEKIRSKEYVYHANVVLNRKNVQNIYIESNFQFTPDLKLKVGALIMMIDNDPCNRWVNGTLGIIKKLEPDKIFVAIDSEVYQIPKTVFKEYEAVYTNGRIKYEEILNVEQYPLVLAYAMTIHKSQGMTYKQIAVDLSRCFAPGQAYVALSRCSTLEGLHLLSEVNNDINLVDSKVEKYYLRERTKEYNFPIPTL